MQASSDGNKLSDFPPDQFTISLFCDACDHRADLDREKVPEGMTIQELRHHLRCSACGESGVLAADHLFGGRRVSNIADSGERNAPTFSPRR